MPTAIRLALLSALTLTACARQESSAPLTVRPQAVSGTFHNPVKTLWTEGGNPRSIESPDPWLSYYGGYYYLTTTTVSNIQIRRARSLGELTNAPDTVVWSDGTASRCCNLWASEFHRLTRPDGQTRWYLYYAADDGNDINHRLHVLESNGDDPLGPYSYKAALATNTGWAIDGTVFKKSGGGLYFLWSGRPDWNTGHQHVYIAAMKDPWTLSSSAVKIATPQYDWEKSGNWINEAPEVVERVGKTFVTYSASGCWTPDYKLGLLTNTDGNLLNAASWSKRSTPVFQTNTANNVYGPGHNGFFKSPDGTEDWMVYHATASNVGGCGGPRTTRVQKITWNTDGTPNFPSPASLGTALTLPAGEGKGVDNLLQNADFEGGMSSWSTWPGNNGTDADADFTEGGGYDGTNGGPFNGANRLTHYKASNYQVYTSQTVNVPNGTYALEAWVVGSGDQSDAFMSAKDYGGAELKARVVGDNNPQHWRKISIGGISVTNGKLTVGFYSFANARNWMSADRVRLYRQ